MKQTVIQRISLVLKENSISVNALAKQIGIAQATLNPQLRGDRALSSHIVELILSAFPDVSAEWLMRGVGTMYKDKEIEEVPSMVAEDIHFPSANEESIWKAKYGELEKRYDQLLSILGGGVRQSKVNVG